jgi:hypothetical protein
MWKKWLSGERMNSMVGADFGSAEAAESAADAVRADRGLDASGLQVIRPQDPEMDRKLEPESGGIAGTLVRAHVVLGVLGLLGGLTLSLALVAFGIQPLAASPIMSVGVITAFATVAGLLLGGLFSLRPDHDPLIHQAKSSARSGRWFVVVHTRKPEQKERAASVLDRFTDDTVRTA